MLTKFNGSNDMNTVVSDAIHSYIKDGYHIDAKESAIDPVKDNDCTFKAVLKKDVDGIECKSIITLCESKNDNSHTCKYHKVETVGDTKWSEETRSFSTNSVDFTKPKDTSFIPNLKSETVKDDKLDKNKMSSSFTVSKKDLKKSFNSKCKYTSNDSTKNDSKPFNVKGNVKENKTNDDFDDDLMKLIHRIFYIV